MSNNFKVVESTIESLDSFITLLDEVGEWLWNKGLKQWAPNSFSNNRAKFAASVTNGCLILAYQEKVLAGGCILTNNDPGWPDQPENAMYLGSLAVARFAAGEGLGGQILKASEVAVAQRGKSRLLLDCWEGNEFLKSYYERHGFTKLDRLPVNDYEVRLFEKRVGEI